jgi:hypothetical protein
MIGQPARSLNVAKRNRGITVGSQTGHSAARIFRIPAPGRVRQGQVSDFFS